MSQAKKQTGEEFKQDLHNGKPKFGIFVNSASQAVVGQLSFSGYDWLLIDFQHGALDYLTLGAMINAVHLGKAKAFVRVGGYSDRSGIQQALDLGADGILIPYINNKKEAEEGVSCCYYPTKGTRSIYFPQPSMNEEGLLGYAGTINKNVIVAIQIETADCIKNIDEIMTVPGIDIAFLGQNDLCLSMGLFEKNYVFPQMYFSPELNEATNKMLNAIKKNNKLAGVFLFGTDRVAEFLQKGFTFISVGNDLHHVLTATTGHIKNLEAISAKENKPWTHQSSALI
jgi:4-hydroxy-2-oxoheptanedioate aldolase